MGEPPRRPPRDVGAIFSDAPLGAARPEELREPLPGFLSLPGRMLAVLPRRARRPVGGALLLLLVAAPFALWTAQGAVERRDARERRAATERRLVALAADQAPRRSVLVTSGTAAGAAELARALERAITQDVSRRQRTGSLAGRVQNTACRPGRRIVSASARPYLCFAQLTTSTTLVGELVSGYRFRAAASPRTGALVWCKENPRPIHPDTQGYTRLPLDPVCLGD